MQEPKDVVVVVKRLPHAHEHNVGNAVAVQLARAAVHEHVLVHNLAVVHIADKAHRARGTEGATQRTAHLRGDARRDPLAGRNEHALHVLVIVQMKSEFGGFVLAVHFLGYDCPMKCETIGQLLPQSRRDVGHLVKTAHALLP